MAKAPAPRGFTLAEVRALSIEKRTFFLTIAVALFAATISFIALHWVGVQIGMHKYIAPLLPLTIDGLGIICSFGIIRSHGAGEPWRQRASEWLGLSIALCLSMVGNAAHALGVTPIWLKVTYSIAVPGVVAYSIHVLGKYTESGISSHVLADDPDKVRFDVQQINADPHARTLAQASAPRVAVKPARTERATAPATARATEDEPARTERATAPVQPEADERATGKPLKEKDRARQIFIQHFLETGEEMPAVELWRRMDSKMYDSTYRRWVTKWAEELPDRRADLDLAAPEPAKEDVLKSA
mgnify:CR=1 FL=1